MLGILVYLTLSSAFIILSCLLFVYCFKKNGLRFEQVLPLSLMSIALLMFLLTVIFHNIGLSVILTIALQLIGLLVFVVLDKERKNTIIQFLRSPALFIFIFVMIALYILNYGRILTGFDDLIHWGPFVSDTLRLNDFYNSSTNLAFSVHGDYPPAAALFEVFYLKITANQQWLMFVANQLLCIAMLFPLFSTFIWKKKSKLSTVLNMSIVLGLILAGLLSVELQTGSAFFYEIRIDTLLACMGAYGIYVAMTEGKKFSVATVIKLSILVTFMLLLKQIAVVIAAFVVLLYIVMLFTHREDNSFMKRPLTFFTKANRLRIIVIVVALLVPVLFYKLWSVQVAGCLSDNICTGQFSASNVNLLKIPLILVGHSGTPLQQDTARHFMNYIYTGGTLINSDTFKLTYPQFILLFCGVMFSLAVYAHRKKQRVTDVVVVAGVVLIGYFAYLYVLLGTYLYGGFSVGEMQILASADRYIGTYILTMILVAIMVFVELWGRVNGSRVRLFVAGAVTLFILCLALNPIAYKSLLPYSFLNYSRVYDIQDFKAPIDTAVSTITSDPGFNKLSVIVLAECNNQTGLWESNYLRYQVRPNPYLVIGDAPDGKITRNIDYAASVPYVDPAGRSEDNAQGNVSVYVVAMCSDTELNKYNNQNSKLIHFDDTTNIQLKWQVFKTTAKGDYYNTLSEELNHLEPIH